VHIVSFTVHHYRDDPPIDLGELGRRSQSAFVGDDVRVEALFDRLAYCYLLALDPGGKQELCYPESEAETPQAQEKLIYPASPLSYFPLDPKDGVGLQAFVLLASSQPLPSYQEWQVRGSKPPWKPLAPELAVGVWHYDGEQVRERAPLLRSMQRVRGLPLLASAAAAPDLSAGLAGIPWTPLVLATRDGPVQHLFNVCQSLKDRPGVDAVQGMAFAVRPKE
jgi:hypothetical protein